MRKVALFCGALLLAATMFFVACGKDYQATIQKFITVTNATLVEEDMPAATMAEAVDVLMGLNVIPGGSSFVTVNAPVAAQKILVGIKDQTGYYEVPVTNDRDYTYDFVMIVDQRIDLGEDINTFTLQVAIMDANGNVSRYWESPIGLVTVGTGNLQVSLTFDQHKDIDLHLIEPEIEDDTLSYYQRHIYFGNRVSANGGMLDIDANAGCSHDTVWAENITYGDDAYVRAGLYKVYVAMWSNCSPQDAPTHYTLSVFYQGQLISTQNGVTNPLAYTFPADAPSTGSNLDIIEPAMTFVIPEHGHKAVRTFEPLPLTESAIEKLAMEADE